MLVLEEIIDVKDFKRTVYKEYKKLFPKEERKSYSRIKKLINNNILNVYKILDDNTFVGFMMFNTSKKSKYLQLDYFGILKEYQCKGYGSKAINLLKESSKEYDGIFIEMEKLGLGNTKEENELRVRRKKFYNNLGFYELNYDLELYNVIFTPLILPISNVKEEDEEKIMMDVLNIYYDTLGINNLKKHCKIESRDGKQLF